MRAVVKVKQSQGRTPSNATRYVAGSKLDPEREGDKPRSLFTNKGHDNLTYRKANGFLTGRKGAPIRNDLIHFLVSFLKEDFDALLMTFIRNLFYDIFFIGSIADLPFTFFCIPQTKSIVMSGDESDVLHPSILCCTHPFLRVKVNGIENMNEPLVFFYLDIPVIHYPFTMT